MTKAEAQEKYNDYINNREKLNKYNAFVNENADGYCTEASTTLVDEIMAAGYVPNFSTGLVYDNSDFNKMREDWNNAAKSLVADGIQLSIPVIESKSGVDNALLQSLKRHFVK